MRQRALAFAPIRTKIGSSWAATATRLALLDEPPEQAGIFDFSIETQQPEAFRVVGYESDTSPSQATAGFVTGWDETASPTVAADPDSPPPLVDADTAELETLHAGGAVVWPLAVAGADYAVSGLAALGVTGVAPSVDELLASSRQLSVINMVTATGMLILAAHPDPSITPERLLPIQPVNGATPIEGSTITEPKISDSGSVGFDVAEPRWDLDAGLPRRRQTSRSQHRRHR